MSQCPGAGSRIQPARSPSGRIKLLPEALEISNPRLALLQTAVK
jgi:hypothetical protein